MVKNKSIQVQKCLKEKYLKDIIFQAILRILQILLYKLYKLIGHQLPKKKNPIYIYYDVEVTPIIFIT